MLVARRFLPGDGGHPPLEGIGGGAVPVVNGPGIALAALGTLSFGAVLGPEAPLIALGAVVGGVVTLFASVDEKGEGVLATAGSFSAISALFGRPIVGGMMLVEGGLGMGSALLPILLPGFVAAAIGYVLFIGLGDWGGLSAQGLAVPSLPPYTGTHIYDLIVGVAVGVVAAVIVAVVRRAAGELTREGPRRVGMPVLLIGGGPCSRPGRTDRRLARSGLAGRAVLRPGRSARRGDRLGEDPGDPPGRKGARLRGQPRLRIPRRPGIPRHLPRHRRREFAHAWFDVSPTLAVAVGSAAGMAAGTRLLITSTLFAGLLVGHAGLDAIPAAVLAAAAAWLTMQALDRRSTRAATTAATT